MSHSKISPIFICPTEIIWWVTSPLYLQCRAGTESTHKSFKGCEGLWAHLCMCMGTGRGRGGWQHRFFSPYFSFTSTMQRDYKRVFSLDLKCYLGNEHYFKWFLLLQIVPLLKERSLFITSFPSDYIKQRGANIFEFVCFWFF